MRKLFSANKYLPIALALAGFAAAGSELGVGPVRRRGVREFRGGMLGHTCIRSRPTSAAMVPTRKFPRPSYPGRAVRLQLLQPRYVRLRRGHRTGL